MMYYRVETCEIQNHPSMRGSFTTTTITWYEEGEEPTSRMWQADLGLAEGVYETPAQIREVDEVCRRSGMPWC